MKRIIGSVSAAVFVFAVLMLALKIDVFFYLENARSYARQSDVLYNIFGQLRNDIAAILYLKSDEYFHGGTEHPHGEEHTIADELSGEHKHHEDVPSQRQRGKEEDADIFLRLDRAIHAHRVQHLAPDQSAEIVPWFSLAVLVDPEYVQAYVVGGYWLGMRLNRPDEALLFLKKGLKSNPQAWQIYSQIGDIYFLAKKDYRKAAAYLERAYLAMDAPDVNKIDKKHVLIFLATAWERLEDYRKSVYYYEKLEALVPDPDVAKKIAGLNAQIKGISVYGQE
ncbi:MAG: tetratricopeptide repeat protein [Candidatus Omnitrophica bacterium]|nr:tetratricopeptide repeat protein [Candidatus Omnitrophota bacterium]MBU4478430.1 tetratricopeptide repeat protein [Candidatus Omnitrophota bacterium]